MSLRRSSRRASRILRSETLEGAALLDEAAKRADDAADAARLRELAGMIRAGENAEINEIAHSGELEVLMATYPDRAGATQYAPGAAGLSSTEKRRERPPGMNSFPAPRKAAAIAARPFAIACRGSTTRRRWDST